MKVTTYKASELVEIIKACGDAGVYSMSLNDNGLTLSFGGAPEGASKETHYHLPTDPWPKEDPPKKEEEKPDHSDLVLTDPDLWAEYHSSGGNQ